MGRISSLVQQSEQRHLDRYYVVDVPKEWPRAYWGTFAVLLHMVPCVTPASNCEPWVHYFDAVFDLVKSIRQLLAGFTHHNDRNLRGRQLRNAIRRKAVDLRPLDRDSAMRDRHVDKTEGCSHSHATTKCWWLMCYCCSASRLQIFSAISLFSSRCMDVTTLETSTC